MWRGATATEGRREETVFTCMHTRDTSFSPHTSSRCHTNDFTVRWRGRETVGWMGIEEKGVVLSGGRLERLRTRLRRIDAQHVRVEGSMEEESCFRFNSKEQKKILSNNQPCVYHTRHNGLCHTCSNRVLACAQFLGKKLWVRKYGSVRLKLVRLR